jgi:hypothetical protein
LIPKEIWDAIAKLAVGTIIMPGTFSTRFNLGCARIGLVEDTLVEATRLGILEPVYRLDASAEFLETIEREEWTTNLASLRQIFRTDDAQEIDGSNPSSICVAFRVIKCFAPEKPVPAPQEPVSEESEVTLLHAKVNAAKNLLAVMHRDGGHHTEKVGFLQSCKDAITVFHYEPQRRDHFLSDILNEETD